VNKVVSEPILSEHEASGSLATNDLKNEIAALRDMFQNEIAELRKDLRGRP